METKDTAVALLKEWKRLDNSWVDEDNYRDELGEPIEDAEAKIDAAELHALLGWLLLKEGGGNA